MFCVIDHAVPRDMTREERLQRSRELYRLRRGRETPKKKRRGYEEKEKMPEEDVSSAQSTLVPDIATSSSAMTHVAQWLPT